MRESILFSKTIRSLLAVFITNPKERFYLRRLCAITGISPRPVQLALAKLERAGILNSEREANIKFYAVNESSPIYPEIKSIILKTEAVGASLKEAFKDLKKVKCAFIYGSVAKGKERSGSDIDICVIGETGMDALSRTTAKLEEKLKREISVVTFSPREWKAAIRGKKAFAMDILKGKKIILFGGLK
jgi:predicted nucleotidyltransferase